MRKSKFMLSSWLMVVAAMLVSGSAVAASANAANGKTIFTQGKGDAQACVGCHGDKAQGNDQMGAPRLAGIGYGYVVKQLTNFSQDKRTPAGMGAVMNGFAKALSEQDRRDVAAYVSSLDGAPELSDLKALKDQGQQIGQSHLGQVLVQQGRVQNGITACSSCHEYNGRGADPIFPKIGQQKYVYLVNQLKSWRDGSRANDPSGMMRAVAKNMTDDDIVNVASFLSSAPATKGAGDTAPDNGTLLHTVTH